MIQQILPPVVAGADTTADLLDSPVFPEEEAYLEQAVEYRRREFVTTRGCARSAMAALGLPPAPVGSGAKGEPRWPAGVTGSMTHCDGYRAAAVSRSRDYHSVGIDAERHEPLPAEVVEYVTVAEERAHLRELARTHPHVHWATVLFSAKETVYKAWYPLARRWLGFRDARLTFDPDAGTYTARLLVPGPVVDGTRIGWLTGHWSVRDGIVLTAIAVRRGR
ncbi:4'-phosphopantetheinyl transferase [Streptomyces incarnatus]|uniref:4'-phosphopantetheinyl transferase n=1 Tax=Streptomyces incarnatus TaxID=665007 RepID=A0ABM5TK49_9ACTN|nr:4'-phosphopantetheinyl transferase superfamily protein [Streptomyces incarnatus]AKJ11322.1 4'-phosphopantetheinyl transferase [Streptomyces incarnatus]